MRPVRILHMADVHVDASRQLAGAVRLEADGMPAALANTARCVRHAVEQAGDVELYIIAGDLFDTANPTPLEVRVGVELVHEMATLAPVVVLAGNHDIPGSGGGASALEGLALRGNVHVVHRPGVVRVGSIAVACVPYPRRSELVALAPDGSREERNALASQALASIVRGLRLECEGTGATHSVAAYHGTITGAVAGAQPRSLAGDIQVPDDAFAGYQYVAAGHIHRRQEVGGTGRVWYSGSIDRCTFDEEHEEPGANVVTLHGDGRVDVEHIRTPARRYVTVAHPPGWPESGTVYRVKASCTPQDADALRRTVAGLSSAGAWITTALEVVTEARARDTEATADAEPGAVLRRWLEADAGAALVRDVAQAHGATPEAIAAAVLAVHEGVAA